MMDRNSAVYQAYLRILKEELVPATGCTEPIAVAYCAAVARDALCVLPDFVCVEASGNIIKNVKSVVIPNTRGQKGLEAAAAAGIIAGKAAKKLEVIAEVSETQQKEIAEYLISTKIEVKPAQTEEALYIQVCVSAGAQTALSRITGSHTNVVYMEKDGEALFTASKSAGSEAASNGRELLSIGGICEFAKCAELSDVKEILDRQIACNTAVAKEGLKNPYGANVGKVLLNHYGGDILVRARAMAAAGSDARMGGCGLPVVINSGSGNQGLTASLPVIEFAKELGSTQEELYRALLVSNLCTIHQKTAIGKLSAYCGAICAGCGAGAGIAYLHGGGVDEVAHTVVNTLAITSGIVCDGAKPSCAGKIATAVEAGILGYFMYRDGYEFRGGEGIVSKGVENTIRNVGRLGRDGMRETDKEIIRIMMDC